MRASVILAGCMLATASVAGETVEFCLDGRFDLGARYQGTTPGGGEFYPARWCVISDDASERVLFSASGRSNPDMEGTWTVALLPPDLVRIVNSDAPPDIEFRGADSLAEARRHRRIDPRRLIEELAAHPDDSDPRFDVVVQDGRLATLRTSADLPLRGRVPVVWSWDWSDKASPALRLEVDGEVLMRARGTWRTLSDQEAGATWKPTPGADPVQVPGEHWPARTNMTLVNLTGGVYLVQTVRTGFQHLVVVTNSGLVIADAPAGWVELHQIPPRDLVPGLGISGLAEEFINFLRAGFPGKPLRAVALTHHHDDHAGGARAFAAAGADVYAPAEVAGFLQAALNRDSMPSDRLAEAGATVHVNPVEDAVTLDDDTHPVQLINMGSSPHSASSLGVLAGGFFFQSDLHVPNSAANEPRMDRLETECWFARWASDNLPSDSIVINTHSQHRTPLSRLGRYLESGAC